MVLCDVNVWLALALSHHLHHETVATWFADQSERMYFCRATQQSFLRLLTNAAVLAPYGNLPLTNQAAWEVYASFQADDRIDLAFGEPAGLEPIWKQFALTPSPSPKLWMDAYLAAFAVAGGYTMVTTDFGFRQFESLELQVLGM